MLISKSVSDTVMVEEQSQRPKSPPSCQRNKLKAILNHCVNVWSVAKSIGVETLFTYPDI